MCALCALFGVSKQAYYKHDECKTLSRLAAESFAIEYVMNVRSKDPLIGGLKLWHMYKREFQGNAPLGRDRFADLLDREGLKVRRRIRKPRTTDSRHGLPVWCDLTKELIPTRRDQLWVSDITYITIWTDELHYSFCYLSLIQDAFTKEIIGWSVGPTLDTAYPLQALETALKRIDGVENADGNPKDNARAERINGTIKNELLGGMRFHSIDQVREAVRKAVDFYNNERPHMSIDMLTPSQAAARSGEIAKRWTSYREKAIREKLRDLKNKANGQPTIVFKYNRSQLYSGERIKTVNLFQEVTHVRHLRQRCTPSRPMMCAIFTRYRADPRRGRKKALRDSLQAFPLLFYTNARKE